MDAESLSALCSSVCCCQAPPTEPSTCADILLVKYETRESVLLQLSALRCLYSAHRQPVHEPNFRGFSLKTVDYFTQNLPCLYILLSEYLNNCDQYICFCVSKALVAVLLHTGTKAHIVGDIFTKLQTQINTHVGIYCLQTIREFLKIIRKNLNAATVSKDHLMQSSSECLQTITDNDYWNNTLQLFLTETSDTSQCQSLCPTIAEFLSLTVELLRHDKQRECRASCLSHCIVTSLLRILNLVERFENVFIMKRFVDVTLKVGTECGSEDVLHSITPAVTALLSLPISKSVAQCWVGKIGKVLADIPIKPQTENDYGHTESVSIAVRKTTLLVMKSVAGLLGIHTHSQNQSESEKPLSHTALCGVMAALKELLSSCFITDSRNELKTEQYTCVLYQVVSEEDGCLVHALQASNSILKHSLGSSILVSVPGLSTFVAVTNPHSLWLCFLLHVDFDHSVLLDLLLSPETHFTATFHDYLLLVASDWSNFNWMCRSVDPSRLGGNSSPQMNWSESSSIDESRDRAKESTSKEEDVSVAKSTQVLVEYSLSSSSEDEELTSCHVNHTMGTPTPFESEAQPSGKVPQPSQEAFLTHSPEPPLRPPTPAVAITSESPQASTSTTATAATPLLPSSDPLLDRVMGCLVRLRLSLERLTESGLMPWTSCSEVISAIETTEKLYEIQ